MPSPLVPCLVCLLIACLSAAHLRAGDPIVLEVSAGASARRGVPVRWDVPDGVKIPPSFELIREDGGAKTSAQLDDGTPPAIVWIIDGELAQGAKRRYRLEAAPARDEKPAVECIDTAGKSLGFRVKGKPVAQYNYGVVQPPEKIEPIFARSGYLHPLWTPSGRVVTNDFPPNHKHHHGVWMPWTNTEFEGRHVNFWEQGEGLGTVECLGVDARAFGPVFGGFRSRHRFLDLKAPGGPKPVLDETWNVKVYALDGAFLVDFTSVQKCSGASPLQLKEYRYGGFGFRGTGEWEGKDGCEFLTSEGKTRADGHATKARWCEMHGKVSGETAGVLFLCHPANFRFPQNMRIHPDEPFFNFTPCQAGDFEIVPGKPYVSRYRLVIHDGALASGEAERLWRDYAEPPAAALVPAESKK